MKTFKWILLSCVLVTLGDRTTLALEGHPNILIEFSVFPLEPGDWEGLYYAPMGDPKRGVEELSFNPHERTLGYRYSGSARMRFFRKSISQEEETVYNEVGALNLGSSDADRILFFQPHPSEPKRYQINAMEDTSQTFPDESIVFYNTTKATFQGILGNKRISLEPGQSDPIKVTDYFKEPAPIALVVRDGEDLHKVLMNKLRFSPNRRTLLILRAPQDPESLRIRAQRLTEYTGPRSGSEDPGA